MLRQEFRRMFLSPFFYLSILCGFIMGMYQLVEEFCLGGVWEPPVFFSFPYLIIRACSGNFFVYCSLYVGWAVADSYCIESESGYRYSVMVRSNKIKYCLSKFMAAVACGFLVQVISVIFLTLFMAVYLLPFGGLKFADLEPPQSLKAVLGRADELANEGKVVAAGMRYCLLSCFYGALFPAISLCISLVVRNKYMVMAFPYLLSFSLSTISVIFGTNRLTFAYWSVYGFSDWDYPHNGNYVRALVYILIWVVEALIFTGGVMREMGRKK